MNIDDMKCRQCGYAHPLGTLCYTKKSIEHRVAQVQTERGVAEAVLNKAERPELVAIEAIARAVLEAETIHERARLIGKLHKPLKTLDSIRLFFSQSAPPNVEK